MTYRQTTVRPIAGALGAEISGVDLSAPLDDASFADIHAAYLEHLVLFFPDQRLDPEALIALGRRFGELEAHPFLPNLKDHPEVVLLQKKETAETNVGNGWHSDMSFLETPPAGSVLYALDVPPYGGDTLFANMYLVHDSLSDGLKQMLGGRSAIHDYTRVFLEAARRGRTSASMEDIEAARDEMPPVEHPVFRTHPETGRKLLYVNPFFTSHLKDISPDESRPILEYLYQQTAKPESTCRYRWREHTVALWDNRCTQHYAVNDYHGHRRTMHRITIRGDRPF
ncbi:MAG: TauD/TfdA family dioxygenase [Gemmatimonadota bacterium]|nr:TauD/TfdA family dioxygenase [Gemmatimonadota bacterium]